LFAKHPFTNKFAILIKESKIFNHIYSKFAQRSLDFLGVLFIRVMLQEKIVRPEEGKIGEREDSGEID
jgi:phosphoribosylamine-glycine ligase